MKTTKSQKQWLLRAFFLLVGDVILICLSASLALWLKNDLAWEPFREDVISDWFREYCLFTSIYTVIIFMAARLYNRLWSSAGLEELLYIAVAVLSATVLTAVLDAVGLLTCPSSLPFLDGLLLFFMVSALRFSYRLARKFLHKHDNRRVRTMIVGAGDMGNVLLREFENSYRSQNRVVCMIDDDPRKIGKYIHGIQVAGGRESIPACVKKYRVQEIIFAIPTADRHSRQAILNICKETDCKLRIIPGIFQLTSGEVQVQRMRDVQIEDLLERDSVKVDWKAITAYVNGKTVLVTGGGGSIGSELCRQIAKHAPKQLIIFDVYENNAYEIQQELLFANPNLNLTVLIGSVRDAARVNEIFAKYGVDLVYHAAAHKHVPLMETSPLEAVKNNIFGTQNVARAAGEYGVQRFVMISTDKAVNPTNVMGASKRVCEMVVQQEAEKHPATTYAAVRFGNVLGSNGSVIPLFRKQIEAGGPVTVTHPDIIRYFMTIPEAVSLVLQAGALAKGGEIFVLDMGDPVRIDDLARNMIRLSGLTPDVDIPVVYTGLRPGEKLYEELLMAEEGLTKTANDMIFIGHQMPVDGAVLTEGLHKLAQCGDMEVRDIFRKLVPTYHTEEAPAVKA